MDVLSGEGKEGIGTEKCAYGVPSKLSLSSQMDTN